MGTKIATFNRQSESRGLLHLVDRPLDLERILAPEPGERQVQQLSHRLAPMVPRDLLMQMPPHALDRVAIRAVCWQQVQIDPLPVLPQIDRHRLAGITLARKMLTIHIPAAY